jgi:hypothetical protein
MYSKRLYRAEMNDPPQTPGATSGKTALPTGSHWVGG